jgi:hypothetical protein
MSPTLPILILHLLYNLTMPEVDPAPNHSPAAAADRQNTGRWLVFATAGLALILLIYFLFRGPAVSGRPALLSWMPADSEAVLFLDFEDLKQAPFFADLQSWAPQPAADPEYRQFVQDTGFNYESDLQRVAVAFEKQGSTSIFFAVADGRFDQRRITTYAVKAGALHPSNRPEIYSLPATPNRRPISFTFVAKNRMAFTNAPNLEALLDAKTYAGKAAWRSRFQRVAGSPIFIIVSNDGMKSVFASDSAPQELARRAAAGLTSPQLSALLEQLQWLTVAGKPESDRLRIVADGESLEEARAKQLTDLPDGVGLIPRPAFGTPRPQQINATSRESYLALLNSVDVTQIDRGETKSVRLMLDLDPKLLKSPQIPAPSAPTPAPAPAPVPASPKPKRSR